MEDATPFPGVLYFTLDPYLIMLSVKQGGIKYHFWVFGMTPPGSEAKSPWPLANTLFYIIIKDYNSYKQAFMIAGKRSLKWFWDIFRLQHEF